MCFLHTNVNRLLPKIEEIRFTAKKFKLAVTGTSEIKLDRTILWYWRLQYSLIW